MIIHSEIAAAVCLGRELSDVLSFLKYHCDWQGRGRLLISFAARQMDLPANRFLKQANALAKLGFIKVSLRPGVIEYSISDHGEETA